MLAQINDLTVSVNHFETAYKEYFYRTGQVLTPTESTRKAILDSEFNTYVMAVHAKDLGLDKTREAEYQRLAIEKRVLTEEYLNQVILSDAKVTEADLREYFLRFNSSLRASHIYAATKEKADEYYDRLQNGETFEELAREAFSNQYMAENGGDVGRFTTDEMDISFENAAFALNVGEISEPVKTAQGYSIIKLTDRVIRPLITEYEFNQNKGRLQTYVWQKKKEVVQREHLQMFTEESIIDDETFSYLYNSISESYDQLLSKQAEFISSLSFDDEVLRFNSFELEDQALREELLTSSTQMLNSIRDERSFKNFILGIAYRAYMVDEAKKLAIDEQDMVITSIEETHLHYLEDLAIEYLKSQVTHTQAELYQVFTEQEHQFVEPEYVRVQRLVVKGEEEASDLHLKLMDGADFGEMVIASTQNNEDRFIKGDLGFVPIDDFGFNGPKIAELNIGGISEIIPYTGDEFHIYKVLDRQESFALTFDEAREKVSEFLTRQKLQTLRKETISQVKEKHNAFVDLEKLNALTIKI